MSGVCDPTSTCTYTLPHLLSAFNGLRGAAFAGNRACTRLTFNMTAEQGKRIS
jgi:hypothetical protein